MARLRTWHVIPLAVLAVAAGLPAAAAAAAKTYTITAATPGAYHYLCPVPGHAQKGMTGPFTVSNTR